MDKILEKFGRYLIDKCKAESINGTPLVDYYFRFENDYGAAIIIEQFANFRLYDVATVKFIDGGDKFEFVKVIPERYIKAIMCRPVEEVCEYLQTIKDL
jgi:hypothetical protein